MFTGIVEELGEVKSIANKGNRVELEVLCKVVLEDTKIGDSICTNGVCLTVTKLNEKSFSANIMTETLRVSSLNNLKTGNTVNLERALTLNTRLGGHIVSGHIDGIGTIKGIKPEINGTIITIEAGKDILKYIIYKGSIAIDGISLTVMSVTDRDFSVSLIPHTLEQTTLNRKKQGDIVNLECDLFAKYTEKLLMNAKSKNDISESFLRERGFM